jgi:hypothetical protein
MSGEPTKAGWQFLLFEREMAGEDVFNGKTFDYLCVDDLARMVWKPSRRTRLKLGLFKLGGRVTTGDYIVVANTALCLAAGIFYAASRNWASALYWLAAVLLNSAVLWRSL